MVYRMMGRMHAAVTHALRAERGQGTVEYVALILLVAVVLAGVVTATKSSKIGTFELASTIVNKLKAAIGDIGKAK